MELQYAIKHGSIERVFSTAVYDSEVVFDRYVKHFYKLKEKHTQEQNTSWRMIDKFFLNSLYGKFGQIFTNRTVIEETDKEGVWRLLVYNEVANIHYQEMAWYGKVYQEIRDGETSFSFPAISGAITAGARILLWNRSEDVV